MKPIKLQYLSHCWRKNARGFREARHIVPMTMCQFDITASRHFRSPWVTKSPFPCYTSMSGLVDKEWRWPLVYRCTVLSLNFNLTYRVSLKKVLFDFCLIFVLEIRFYLFTYVLESKFRARSIELLKLYPSGIQSALKHKKTHGRTWFFVVVILSKLG